MWIQARTLKYNQQIKNQQLKKKTKKNNNPLQTSEN